MKSLADRVKDAYIDRQSETIPTITEIELLYQQLDILNTSGSTDEYIDMQSELINALVILAVEER